MSVVHSASLPAVQQCLEAVDLSRLFLHVLHWAAPHHPPQPIPAAQGLPAGLVAVPVAELAGVLAFRLDWPEPGLPTLAERRAVSRVLAGRFAEHLLCVVASGQQVLAVVWPRHRPEGQRELRALTYERGTPARTTVEQLAQLRFELDELAGGGPSLAEVLERLDRAFDVQAVSERFYDDYAEAFHRAEELTTGLPSEARCPFVQRLFDQLLFVRFVERKGWLRFNGRADYLRALWEDYQTRRGPDGSFYAERLRLLFHAGLNTPHEVDVAGIRRDGFLARRIGQVPFLNGGLFEEREEETLAQVPDDALAPLVDDLLYRYNLTVSESTPLDLEVAVDPEMLGQVFERLVTYRHETGAYYTPRPIVSFMCQQALRAYLASACPGERPEALTAFVERHDPAGLRDPEAVLDALRRVTVCDPACGSGAYLVGMLQELLELRRTLFQARSLDPRSVYERKLEIIERSLYGVDLDPMAVEIARLRLWLSLIVDFQGEGPPPPLPNLDFKVATGDSLTAPPPSAAQLALRQALVDEFAAAKAAYLHAAEHGEKERLRQRIAELRRQLATWSQVEHHDGFDWAVEFAEVFAQGGFDIVVTNPPYVRQELIDRQLGAGYKRRLQARYPDVYPSTADLYVAFYGRAMQLLRPGGVGCFISSDKWLRAAYGEKLRQALLDRQRVRLVVDFGELPVFHAAADVAIVLWENAERGEHPTRWAQVRDLAACDAEGVGAHVARIGLDVPAGQFGAGKPRLARPDRAARLERMARAGPRLGELPGVTIYRGVLTGLNEAFVIDRATRDRLVADDPASAELLKPLLVGDDVRRYELHFRERYLVWTYIGVPIERYPAVLRHLERFEERAQRRYDKGEHWWELRACDYYDAFARPKIVWPVIAKEQRFALDFGGLFLNDKCFFISSEDYYLLAVLNSAAAIDYLRGVCSVLGDEDAGGRIELREVFVRQLPIPEAPAAERAAVAALARQAQALHTQRRAAVEAFLRALGTSPAASSSRNPLEQPWALDRDAFRRLAARLPNPDERAFQAAREETAALTGEIARVEREIDERVAALYGVDLPGE
jgi:hypothetical protein